MSELSMAKKNQKRLFTRLPKQNIYTYSIKITGCNVAANITSQENLCIWFLSNNSTMVQSAIAASYIVNSLMNDHILR